MNIFERAKTKGLIFDGAIGTMLIQSGLEGGKVSELWNLEKPEVIKAIHKSYFDAGSDVVMTNTFGGSPLKLKKTDLHKHTEEINTSAVQLAKEVAGEGKYVAGDIGPIGEMLQPYGTLSFEEAVDCFMEQAAYLSKAGADLFIIETMFDLNEAQAAIRAAQSVSSLPIFATLTFQEIQKGFATLMGNRVEEGMKSLLGAGAVVVGANCTLGSGPMVNLAREIRKCVDSPVMINPNAGMPEIKGSEISHAEDRDFFSDNMLKIKRLGVEVIGGCCGSTPDYIQSTVEKIRLHNLISSGP
ncbi:MAG: homocysteine S-methyltransferase family protein [Deltaproteobacteria bacterium]|nr:homocysteine S-methyltransferase family protein [Deltaproteobacteria bacterium]